MNLPREFVRMPDRCPGQIKWHYERAKIIADGVRAKAVRPPDGVDEP
jgi:hypothetical protein